MLHFVRTKVHQLRKSRGNSGFSMVELVFALAMSAVLGLVAAGIVIWTINIAARTQANQVQSAQSAQILSNFENTVRDSDSIVSATANTFSYIFQRFGNCEYHTYTFVTSGSTLNLSHTVQAVTLSAGQLCLNVTSGLIAGTIGSSTNSTDATNLDPTSGFQYFSLDGQRSYRSGETLYVASSALAVCQIGSATMNLVTSQQNIARASVAKTETVTAGIRANSFGLTC